MSWALVWRLGRNPWAWVALLVLAFGVRESCQRRAFRAERLAAQNARADADTLRQLLPGLYEQLAHQAREVRDLRNRPAVVVARTVTDTVEKVVADTVPVDTSTPGQLVTASAIDSGPAHAAARVTITGPTAVWDWRLVIDPIPVATSVRCEPSGPVAVVTLPPALPVASHQTTLDDDVCLGPALAAPVWPWKLAAVGTGTLFLLKLLGVF